MLTGSSSELYSTFGVASFRLGRAFEAATFRATHLDVCSSSHNASLTPIPGTQDLWRAFGADPLRCSEVAPKFSQCLEAAPFSSLEVALNFSQCLEVTFQVMSDLTRRAAVGEYGWLNDGHRNSVVPRRGSRNRRNLASRPSPSERPYRSLAALPRSGERATSDRAPHSGTCAGFAQQSGAKG